tara:strand:- start:794 stop:994 length:201 start_codon:yes stop_codon:yes gene_type:complete
MDILKSGTLQLNIKELAGKASRAGDSGDAMKFSQAALNLANAFGTLAAAPADVLEVRDMFDHTGLG